MKYLALASLAVFSSNLSASTSTDTTFLLTETRESIASQGLDQPLLGNETSKLTGNLSLDPLFAEGDKKSITQGSLRLAATEGFSLQNSITTQQTSPVDNSDFSADPRVKLGLVSEQVLAGGELFFRETFEGNGRSCGTCHPVENNLTIDPNFIRQQHTKLPHDPLFVAEEGHPNHVADLERPDLMIKLGLILENVDGFEDPKNKFMMRSVPHMFSLATSMKLPEPEDGKLPDGSTTTFQQRTGWSGDGVAEPGTLRVFTNGAVIQHYTRDFNIREPGQESFRLPTDQELEQIEAYLLNTGRLQDINLARVSLTDARAETGRALFTTGQGGAKCFGCHNNAGAQSMFGGNRNLNTGIELQRPALLNEQNIPLDGGFGGQLLTDYDFDTDGDGANDSFGNGTFNTPPLIEAADTAPFFHNNAFTTLEEAVKFYSTPGFAASPAGQMVEMIFGEGINLSKKQSMDVAAFLRVINAAFNLDMALQRMRAAKTIYDNFDDNEYATVSRLLELANVELNDAFEVLKSRQLNANVYKKIQTSIRANKAAMKARTADRNRFLERSIRLSERAKRNLGKGLNFKLGEGNLVF